MPKPAELVVLKKASAIFTLRWGETGGCNCHGLGAAVVGLHCKT